MIGDILKQLRTERGLTVAKAAELFGVASRTYSSYELEEREPNLSLINKLADFYQVSTDYLLGRTTVREMNVPPEDAPTDEDVALIQDRVISSYEQMSLEARRLCVKIFMQIVEDVFELGSEDLRDEDESLQELTG